MKMAKNGDRLRGVRQRQWGSWVSEIRHPITKRRVWLGTYPSAKDAAIAYAEASHFLFGSTKNTNLAFHHHHHDHDNDNGAIVEEGCPRSRLSPALKEKLRLCSLEYQQHHLFNEANILLHPNPLIMNNTSICQTTSKNSSPRGSPPSHLSCNIKGTHVISKGLQGVTSNDNANANNENMTQCNGLLTPNYTGWAQVIASSHSYSHSHSDCVEEDSANNSRGDDHEERFINVGDESISYFSNRKDINNSIIGNEEEVRYEEDWISKEMIEELLNSSFSPELDLFIM